MGDLVPLSEAQVCRIKPYFPWTWRSRKQRARAVAIAKARQVVGIAGQISDRWSLEASR